MKDKFEPSLLATTIGSLPHTDVSRGTELMFDSTPEIPSWIQFPRRSRYESMIQQFTEGMPGLTEEDNRSHFATSSEDYVRQLTEFYKNYLAVMEENDTGALNRFGLTPQYAAGFAEFTTQMHNQFMSCKAVMLKGQVTGPFTLGVNLTDEAGKCAYYDEQLHDIILKTVILKAMWQINQLGKFGLPVLIFLDEPSLLGFGNQEFITVSRNDIIRDLNEAAEVVHRYGGRAAVHCEANTDWSILMESKLDLLDFDAYDHFEAITLYPAELNQYLERGGCLGWGIVPTLDREAAARETLPSLISRFDSEVDRLAAMGFNRRMLLRQSLITPSCGAGGVLTEVLAERVLKLLNELATNLRSKYGFAA